MSVARRGRGVRGRIISTDRLDMSVTTKTGAVAQVQELWEQAAAARATARYRQDWVDGDIPLQDKPTMPEKAPHDLRKIAETGETPNALMVVNQVSQQLKVEGIRLAESSKSAPAWDIWLRNGMSGKQIPLTKAVLGQGTSYAMVTPAVGRLDGERTAAIRLRSAMRGTAFFRDDFDEWPEFYVDVTEVNNSDGTAENFVEFVDESLVHRMSCPKGEPDKLQYIDSYRHNMDITPIQRYGLVTLDGEMRGIIEPLIGLLKRIDQDTVDRLVVQRFASWVVRTISGLKRPTAATAEELIAVTQAMEAWLQVGDFMSSDSPDTKFGSIPATPMDGHLKARESDIRDLASIAQVPAYRMLGLSDNIGAEAIAAADGSLQGLAGEFMTVFGEQHEGTMRLAGHAAGLSAVAQDYTSRVQWATIDNNSLQSLAQAIQMLHDDGEGIPYEMLWKKLRNWSQQDTEEALRLREADRERRETKALLEASMSGGPSGNNGADTSGGRTPAGAGKAR